MLFPVKYIHDSELEKIHDIFDHFFKALAEDEVTWQASLFPDWFETHFSAKRKYQFVQYLEEVFRKLIQLELDKRKKLYDAFVESNKIEIACNSKSRIMAFEDLDEDLKRAFKTETAKKDKEKAGNKENNVFVYAYTSVLTAEAPMAKGVLASNIKKHYKRYLSENGRTCPFCGLYDLCMPESEGRAAYDHYLPKVIYPFSSVNMRNLVPTCDACNSKTKGQKDVLHIKKIDDKKQRVLVFYPYDEAKPLAEMSFHLQYQSSFQYDDCRAWKVTITDAKNQEKIDSWTRIYNINERYAEYVSKKCYEWLQSLDTEHALRERQKNFIQERYPFCSKAYLGYVPEKLFYDYLEKDNTFFKLKAGLKKQSPAIPDLD